MNEIDEVMMLETREELEALPPDKLDLYIRYVTRLFNSKQAGTKMTKEEPPQIDIHEVMPDFVPKPEAIVRRKFT